jgi:hypothetical protein
MSTLTLALVQADLAWHDIEANLAHFDQLLAPLAAVDLIVLPEMFTTGFTMASQQQAEPMAGRASPGCAPPPRHATPSSAVRWRSRSRVSVTTASSGPPLMEPCTTTTNATVFAWLANITTTAAANRRW